MKNKLSLISVCVVIFIALISCGEINEIVFAGKVISPNTGEWVNDRLVVLFLKSKEIAREITHTGEYAATIVGENTRLDKGLGVIDGLFTLRVPNTYKLDPNNIGTPASESKFIKVTGTGDFTNLAAWMDSIKEGEIRDFYIPSKNFSYKLIVLPGPISQLPAEIQQPGSIALLDKNRLVAVDPNAKEPVSQSILTNSQARFDQVAETTNASSPAIFPLNNCGGGDNLKQEITQTYIHTIVDESSVKLGVALPLTNWLQVAVEIEKHYGITKNQITTYSTTLNVPPGQNIEYTILRKQTWESGVAVVNNGVEITAPYLILKNEYFEVANSLQKACP